MDTEYILDCAFSLAETTSVENAVLSSPKGAYWTLRELVDTQQAVPEHFLENEARRVLARAPLAQQYYFGLCGLNGLEFSMTAFKERAEHLVRQKIQEDLGVRARGPVIGGLCPEQAQLAQLPLVQREQEVSEGLIRGMLDAVFASQVGRWSEDFHLMQEALAWYQHDAGAEFGQLLALRSFEGVRASNLTTLALDALHAKQARQRQQVEKTRVSRARAAIKKATRLFQNLGKETNLKLFVSGAEVTLAHPQSTFKFVLRPLQVAGWLIDRTQAGRSYTPYELFLYTKDDVYLAKLCVYFKDTPVLDQLLALSMFVESGEELRILEKANFFATEQWSEEKTRRVLAVYPSLEAKLPRPMTSPAGERRHTLDFIGAAQRREDAHWAPFRGRVEQWIGAWLEPATRATHRLLTQSTQVRAHMERLAAEERRALCALPVREQGLGCQDLMAGPVAGLTPMLALAA